MELAAIFGVVWALSLLSFLYSAALSIPAYVNPLGLVIIMAVFLFNPLKVFRHEARFWLLRVCVSFSRSIRSTNVLICVILQGRMLAAPFFHVGFADFWLADQLNSLVNGLLDVHFLFCFYFTNGNWLEAGGKHV